MIFRNPAGAPELACNDCGCRYFDRMTNVCYECGAPLTSKDLAEYRAALESFQAQRAVAPADRAASTPSRDL